LSALRHPLVDRAIPTLRVARQGDVEVFLTEHPVTESGAVVYFVTRDVDALVRAAGDVGVRPTFGSGRCAPAFYLIGHGTT
jgi:hypothetical protein